MRESITPGERLAVTLRYLATGRPMHYSTTTEQCKQTSALLIMRVEQWRS